MFLRSNKLNKDIELSQGLTRIGRAPDRDVVLHDTQVSKYHLDLRVTGDKVEARDKESRNNSKVNLREIRGKGWIELKVKDVINICGFDFRLLDEHVSDGTSGSCVVDVGASNSSLAGLGSKSISLSKESLADSRQFLQLRALLTITSTLRDVLRTEDVLEQAVAILFHVFSGIDRAAICFINDDHVVEPKWWQVRRGDPDSTIRISQHIGRHVAETSEAVITSDAMLEFEDAQSVHASAMRSVMCCPLIDPDGDVFGIIHVDSIKSNMFDELDLEVLAAVAMQIALAINCSRLHAIAVADELLRQDVQQARAVQHRYLPDSPPSIEGYNLAGFYRPARHVGGDFFDYVSLPDGRLAIVLGDVVGKGVPAALTMVRLATETRAGLEFCQTPKALVTRLNQRLGDDFITLVVIVLDPVTGEITISNAGHEPPLLRAVDGSVTQIGFEHSGLPLGVDEDEQYQDSNIRLNPGECLLLFSDGFPDAEERSSGNRFGSDSIAASLGEVASTANETVQHLVDQVDRFIESSPQFDDMCMVCLQRIAM